jgi:hypothetical protein
LITGYSIHGHAIVSADDRIADASGRTPPVLRNKADWARFQAALDRASVTVLGRLGHLANQNPKRRNRIIVSASARCVERRDDAWWWNPADVPLASALAAAAPGGGIVAVPGGRTVFDLFLDIGFDEFHLARAEQVTLPDGTPLFSGVLTGLSAEAILAGRGLSPGPKEMLDPAAAVSLTVWRRP